MKWSDSVDYLHHMETLKYNAILNSASQMTGLSQYHQPMGSCVSKKFSGLYDSFWCCTASGIEAISELQKNIWFKSDNSLLLNAFISSSVVWTEMNAKITQISEFPDSSHSILEFDVKEPKEIKLLVKEESVKSVKINSELIELKKQDRFIVIERVFHNKDRIEIEIDSVLHLVPLKGSENVAAVMYGSILLAQVGEGMSFNDISNVNINDRILKRDSEKLEFYTEYDHGNDSKLIPLFRVEDEEHTVYIDFNKNSEEYSRFSFAKDGSTAYDNEGCIGLHEENKRYTIHVGAGQMETIITEEMILDDLIKTFHRFFGLKVNESTPIKRGWLNLKWKVTTDSGTFLIKQYNKRRYKMYNPEDLSFACAQQARLHDQRSGMSEIVLPS